MAASTQRANFLRQVQGANPAGLGRVISPEDPRDRRFRLPRSVTAAKARTSKYHLARGPILDQGETSECVIYSGDKALTTHPIVNEGFLTAAERTRVYKAVQRLDEWPGENYDGTSVRAFMRYLRARGIITGYRWATSCEAVVDHLLTVGPVLLGTTWTWDMFTPDRWGYVHPSYDFLPAHEWDVAGGHAYMALGCNRKRVCPLTGDVGAIRCLNSWGDRWCQRGRFWLTFRALDQLIQDYGEACAPYEVKVPKNDNKPRTLGRAVAA